MNSHTVLLENVADADHFGQASGQVPADVAHFRHPILGFYGNLTSAKLDFDLIAEVADLRPNWTILLIGPGGVGGPDVDLGLLRLHSNIHILGPRSYEGLPDYLAAFDVAMLPYRMNDLTASSFPLKFFEYLAAGKPVVGTDLPALSEYRGWYLTARSPADFAEAAEVGLFESDDRRRNERRAFAQQHNWNSRMLELGAIITRVLDQQ
jgi:glycosyltransferase involved in cell wall biosynthesis